jgi:hypothetical protein
MTSRSTFLSEPRRSRRDRRSGRLAAGSALLGALAAVSIGVSTGTGSPASAATVAGPGPSWRVELDPAKGQQSNVSRVGSALTLRGGVRTRAAADGGTRARGTYLAPVITTGRPVGAVRVERSGQVPAGGEVAVDVRGGDGSGAWTQWREPDATGVVRLPRPASVLQTRVTLLGSPDGRVPTVSALTLRSIAVPAESAVAGAAAAAKPVTYTVFATREGLVGATTANGHVIKRRDHFAALPSRRMLASAGGHEYRVKVCYKSRCETVPVWDVGPWNTKDDYWNPPSVRQMWKDLRRGRPEARAAHRFGYNGGRDQFGRRVANSAGIDLADGTFWDALRMVDNDWVTVTFLTS